MVGKKRAYSRQDNTEGVISNRKRASENAGQKTRTACDHNREQEISLLRRENAELRMERDMLRDILKKAMELLSKTEP